MEQVAATLLRFPPEGHDLESLSDEDYDKQLKIHAGRIQTLFKEDTGIVAAHATQLLDSLNPAIHTYSYLALLDTIIPTEHNLYPSVQPIIVNKIVAFLAEFDPRQVRYIGSAFTHVFTAVGSGKILPAPLAVELLARALSAVDPSGRMLTSNHLVLAKLAYHSNNAAAALPVLSKDIVFYPGMAQTAASSIGRESSERLSSRTLAPPSYISRDTGLTLPLKSTQVLEFDYILGLLHLSVRAWKPAHAAFDRVVSYPNRDNGVSKIMVEADKFWILTGLLLNGHSPTTPPQTAQSVTRVCNSVNKLYTQIAELFQSPTAEALHVEVALAEEVLAADGTQSLVAEVVAAHPKWQIAHLRQVYTQISVAAIRKALQRPSPANEAEGLGQSSLASPDAIDDDAAGITEVEVQALCQSMIQSGMIKAALRPATDTTPAYLEFLPEEEEMTETEFAQRIGAVEGRIQALRPLHTTTEEHLSLNRAYIRQHIRDMAREKDRANNEDESILGFDAEPDEDLMMDTPDAML